MSFSHMKEGVAKVKLCYILFHSHLLNVKWLDLPDVDCFCGVAMVDVHSAIGVDSGDGEWTFGWCTHFRFASAFVCIEDNKYLVAG